MDDATLKKVLAVMAKSNEATQEKILAKLSPEDVIKIRRMQTPSKLPIVGGNKNRSLGFYYYNLPEHYYRALAMTGIVGFIYRMADEYTPKSVPADLVSEESSEFVKVFHPLLKAKIRELTVLDRKTKAEATTNLQDRTRFEIEVYAYQMSKNDEDIKILTSQLDERSRKIHDLDNAILAKKKEIAGLATELDLKKSEAAAARAGKKPIDIETISDIDQTRYRCHNQAWYETLLKESIETVSRSLPAEIAAIEAEKAKITREKDSIDAAQKILDGHLGRLPKFNIADLDLADVEPSAVQIDEVVQIAKARLNIAQTKEEYIQGHRMFLYEFLATYFEYNPDEHVRHNYHPSYLDKVSRLYGVPPGPEFKDKLMEMKKYEHACVPPKDTFHRLNFYMSTNLESIRQACDDWSGLNPAIDLMIAPMEVFEGSEDEQKKQYDAFKMKYSKEMDTNLIRVNFNNWAFVADWEENRAVLDMFSRDTELMKRMVDEIKDQTSTASEMVKDRAKKKKQENEKVAGSNDPNFEKARAHLGSTKQLDKLGGVKATGNKATTTAAEALSDSTAPRDNTEASKDEVEVGVHKIKPVYDLQKRSIPTRGLSSQWKFNIPSQQLEEGQAKVTTVAEAQTGK